jgi:hypothetical protein
MKCGRLGLQKEMQALTEIIWISEIMPEECHNVVICPIYNKVDKSECSNYREIR